LEVAENLKNDVKTGKVMLFYKERRIHTIRIPISNMQDIVQPYFDNYVIVTGRIRGKSIFFEDIELGDINQNTTPTTR
jgi:hypothetical protein